MFKLSARFVVTCALIAGTNLFAQNAVLQGEVKGLDGRAAKDAEVRVQAQGKSRSGSVAKTDARGHFAVKGLAAGTYSVQAIAPGGVTSPAQTIKLGDRPVSVTFDLRQPAGAKAAANGQKKKKYVWVPSETGSNLGGRYVEVDDDSSNTGTIGNVHKMSGQALGNMQSRANDKPGSP